MLQVRLFSASLILSLVALAQQPVAPSTGTNGGGVTAVVAQIDQAAQSTNLNLASLRIEKWKTDGNTKQEAQHNTESLQRSLSSALPDLTARARNNPSDVVALFHLYRTIGAVYDVLSNVAETAGAFGPKSEYEQLALDVQRFDQARRDLGDAVEQAATRQSTDLNSLQAAAAAQRSAPVAAPPKKIIVDDTEPAPKKRATKAKPKSKPKKAVPAPQATPQTSPQ